MDFGLDKKTPANLYFLISFDWKIILFVILTFVFYVFFNAYNQEERELHELHLQEQEQRKQIKVVVTPIVTSSPVKLATPHI